MRGWGLQKTQHKIKDELIMGTMDTITFVGGVIFLAYILMANSYWQEAIRWAEKIKASPAGEEKEKAQNNKRRAARLFNLSTGAGVLTIVVTILPAYIRCEPFTTTCKWLLLLPLAAMVVLGIRWASGRYFVPID